MFKKIISMTVAVAVFMAISGVAYAAENNADKSLTSGAASLVLPGWGQYLNKEMDTKSGKIKTGAMIVLEIGGILTTILLATLVTPAYPVIWVGIGILMFNHIWSASDAYIKAPVGPEVAMKGATLER
jgi:hypothetical protein